MHQIVLAGFDVWHEVDYNSAWESVAALRPTLTPGWELAKVRVPVSWVQAVATVNSFLNENVAAVVCVGMARRANCIRLERFAKNQASSNCGDALGAFHGSTKIDQAGPECYVSSVAVDPVYAELCEVGIPAEVSEDAGQYLCNYLFYSLLRDADVHDLSHRVGFVHVPPYTRDGGLDSRQIIESLDITLKSLVRS